MIEKECPKCQTLHNKSGTFCSRQCANSRSFSKETRALKSRKARDWWNNLSENERKLKTQNFTLCNDATKWTILKKAKQVNSKNKIERITTLPYDQLTKYELRQRILLEQKHKCNQCNLGLKWNGKPISLELDHIDGDRENNNRSNLQLICPNCHSQTPTYKGRKLKQKKMNYNDEIIIEALKESDSIYKALKSIGMNPHGGNYVRIRKIIAKYNLTLPHLRF